ncbi:MAG: hypothetical protein RQ757_06980 [Pseudomonadales bacterium]|nr:hypothetical protein [Pseudomonadales bacterium]
MQFVVDAVIEAIQGAVPGLAQIETYAGQFASDGPNRTLVSAPAVFLTVLDAPYANDQAGDGRQSFDLRLAAYCLARNAKGAANRAGDAMSLATAVALLVPQAHWELGAQVDGARLEGMQNQFVAALDNKGLGLWSVTWRQVVHLGESIWAGSQITPTEVWLGVLPESYPEDYTLIAEAPDVSA